MAQEHYIWELAKDLSKEDPDEVREEVDNIYLDSSQDIFMRMKEKYPELVDVLYEIAGNYAVAEDENEKKEAISSLWISS